MASASGRLLGKSIARLVGCRAIGATPHPSPLPAARGEGTKRRRRGNLGKEKPRRSGVFPSERSALFGLQRLELQETRGASENRFNPLPKLVLRQGADLGRRDLPVLEQHQGRNAAHAVLLRRLRI